MAIALVRRICRGGFQPLSDCACAWAVGDLRCQFSFRATGADHVDAHVDAVAVHDPSPADVSPDYDLTCQNEAVEKLVLSGRDGEDNSMRLHMYSANSDGDLATIATLNGSNICGNELQRFKDSFSKSLYPEVKYEESLYPTGSMEDLQMQVLRRHNLTMPCKKNQRVYGSVYAVDRHRVWIDAGHTQLAQLSRDELFVKDIVLEPGEPRSQRSHAHDIRLGDRFVFRIQELKSPLGSIWLEPERKKGAKLLDLVWAELQKHCEAQTPVGGRILNDCYGGYAVGIAGVIGFLPWAVVQEDGVDPQLCQRLGVLQPFLVQSCSQRQNDVTLRFATGRPRRQDSYSQRYRGSA